MFGTHQMLVHFNETLSYKILDILIFSIEMQHSDRNRGVVSPSKTLQEMVSWFHWDKPAVVIWK